MRESRNKPNWLLYGFIFISLAAHGYLVLHLSGIYTSHSVSYIELTMRPMDSPDRRRIPQPRIRRPVSSQVKVKSIRVKPFSPPRIKTEPIKVDPAASIPVAAGMHVPALPDALDAGSLSVPSINVPAGKEAAPTQAPPVIYTSAKEYFQMLSLLINSKKKYPGSALSRNIEGRVKVEFIVLKNGDLHKVKIIKTSRHMKLDLAAVDAVRQAAPFPAPPPDLLKAPVTIRISILFELT